MGRQVRGLTERFVAFVAAVRLLSGMGPQMGLERARSRVRLTADSAEIRLESVLVRGRGELQGVAVGVKAGRGRGRSRDVRGEVCRVRVPPAGPSAEAGPVGGGRLCRKSPALHRLRPEIGRERVRRARAVVIRLRAEQILRRAVDWRGVRVSRRPLHLEPNALLYLLLFPKGCDRRRTRVLLLIAWRVCVS